LRLPFLSLFVALFLLVIVVSGESVVSC